MSNSRTKNVWKYVLPAMLSHVCFSLFSIVDGVFVGNGVGTNALGAIGLVMPFVNAVCALMMLINVGGAESVWLTFAVYEAIVLVAAVVLVKRSERNGIIFK